jgi:hypothetical protein
MIDLTNLSVITPSQSTLSEQCTILYSPVKGLSFSNVTCYKTVFLSRVLSFSYKVLLLPLKSHYTVNMSLSNHSAKTDETDGTAKSGVSN